jgi:hypothetical protein
MTFSSGPGYIAEDTTERIGILVIRSLSKKQIGHLQPMIGRGNPSSSLLLK